MTLHYFKKIPRWRIWITTLAPYLFLVVSWALYGVLYKLIFLSGGGFYA